MLALVECNRKNESVLMNLQLRTFDYRCLPEKNNENDKYVRVNFVFNYYDYYHWPIIKVTYTLYLLLRIFVLFEKEASKYKILSHV